MGHALKMNSLSGSNKCIAPSLSMVVRPLNTPSIIRVRQFISLRWFKRTFLNIALCQHHHVRIELKRLWIFEKKLQKEKTKIARTNYYTGSNNISQRKWSVGKEDWDNGMIDVRKIVSKVASYLKLLRVSYEKFVLVRLAAREDKLL